MMTKITIDDIQRDVLGYLRRVEAGQTFVIVQADQPIAEIKPVEARGEKLRPFGLCAEEFSVPEDFDDALPEEVLRGFEGR